MCKEQTRRKAMRRLDGRNRCKNRILKPCIPCSFERCVEVTGMFTYLLRVMEGSRWEVWKRDVIVVQLTHSLQFED